MKKLNKILILLIALSTLSFNYCYSQTDTNELKCYNFSQRIKIAQAINERNTLREITDSLKQNNNDLLSIIKNKDIQILDANNTINVFKTTNDTLTSYLTKCAEENENIKQENLKKGNLIKIFGITSVTEFILIVLLLKL